MATDTIITMEQEVLDFKEKVKVEAEELVLRKFPQYMLDLDKLFHVSQTFRNRICLIVTIEHRVQSSKWRIWKN